MSTTTLPADLATLTPGQKAFMEALEAWEAKNEEAPGIREFARTLPSARSRKGMSHVQAKRHVDALEKLGWIERRIAGTVHKIYAVRYPSGKLSKLQLGGRRAPELVTLDVEGKIAAGKPILAVKAGEDIVEVPSSWIGRGECFALVVAGDSMKDDAILSGDYVICRRTSSVERGHKAVCLLPDGTATLKRVYREHGRVRLQPANSDYAPIVVDEVEIQGEVVAVLRLE